MSIPWDDDSGVARAHQGLVDAEVRASRRAIVDAFRPRLRSDVRTLVAPDFLALADPEVVQAAIVIAARRFTGATACALHRVDPVTRVPHPVRVQGVSRSVGDHLGAVVAAVASVRSGELRAGHPIVVDHLGDPAVDIGQRARRAVVDAGLVGPHHLHPLLGDQDGLVGILSLHFREPAPDPAQPLLVRCAGAALDRVRSDTGSWWAEGAKRRVLVDITSERTGAEVTTVTVRGPLDVVSAGDFLGEVRYVAGELVPPHTVVLDLRGIDFLAAAGVRALTDADAYCRARGLRCRVVLDAGHHARRTLDRLDLDTTLLVADAEQLSRDG